MQRVIASNVVKVNYLYESIVNRVNRNVAGRDKRKRSGKHFIVFFILFQLLFNRDKVNAHSGHWIIATYNETGRLQL